MAARCGSQQHLATLKHQLPHVCNHWDSAQHVVLREKSADYIHRADYPELDSDRTSKAMATGANVRAIFATGFTITNHIAITVGKADGELFCMSRVMFSLTLEPYIKPLQQAHQVSSLESLAKNVLQYI